MLLRAVDAARCHCAARPIFSGSHSEPSSVQLELVVVQHPGHSSGKIAPSGSLRSSKTSSP